MDQLFSCRFGTFLDNSFYQRAKKDLADKTVPLWWMIADNKESFVNPQFEQLDEDDQPAFPDPLIPSLSPKNVRFFEVGFPLCFIAQMMFSLCRSFS